MLGDSFLNLHLPLAPGVVEKEDPTYAPQLFQPDQTPISTSTRFSNYTAIRLSIVASLGIQSPFEIGFMEPKYLAFRSCDWRP